MITDKDRADYLTTVRGELRADLTKAINNRNVEEQKACTSALETVKGLIRHYRRSYGEGKNTV